MWNDLLTPSSFTKLATLTLGGKALGSAATRQLVKSAAQQLADLSLVHLAGDAVKSGVGALACGKLVSQLHSSLIGIRIYPTALALL